METTCTSDRLQKYSVPALLPGNDYRSIKDYYDIAGPDYEVWSKNFNMHFGFCKKWTDIFRLEKMLVNMNNEVLGQLCISPFEKARIADLGCGVGTVARHAAGKFPLAKIAGITISDYQLQKGNSLISRDHLIGRVKMIKDNFENLQLPGDFFTHAYALESACHAGGHGKEYFISELARVLEPGGRFCIADGFIKHNRELPRFFSILYKKIVRYWALPCFADLHAFKHNLEKYGLTEITIKEISMKIAPSVAWIPWISLKFFVKEILKNKTLRMKKERWHNVYGPILGMILGLYRKHFGYYIISGRKK